MNGERVEQVEEMKYLGAMISGNGGSMDGEVELRIEMVARTIGVQLEVQSWEGRS